MRIVTLSDLHVGKESWRNFGVEKAEAVAGIEADVLYFGGDLAEPDKEFPQQGWDNFRRGLELLARSPASTKVFTLGNNDLEQLQEARLTEHYDEMSERVSEYGFHLLDRAPLIVGDIAFVGNVGWYNGSLWWKYEGETPANLDSKKASGEYPNDPETIGQEARGYFRETEFAGKLPEGLTSELFYQHCRDRLSKHLDEVHSDTGVEAVILGMHFVPDKSFVKGDNPKYAFLNWYMGAEAHADHYQRGKVVLGFTGHTHRSDVRTVGRLDVHNLSGLEQPRVFEIHKNEQGIYEAKKVFFSF